MSTNVPKFSVWIELEAGNPDQPASRKHENFCNILVKTADHRCYALNVWTFDFLPLARYEWPYETNQEATPSLYVLPPDLFVLDLSRATIESVIADLFQKGQMRAEWLRECLE